MTKNIHRHRILILDFGSQYSQLIARRIREIGVYCELRTWNITEEEIRKFNPKGIILSGGPESTTTKNSPRSSQYIFEAGVPVFGICYGMQVMAIQLGGCVESSNTREFGYAKVIIQTDSIITRGIEDSFSTEGKPILDVWMSHGDKVTTIPPNFVSVGSTENCLFAIICNEERNFYGVQFHPEVIHTPQGIPILKRFICDICQCETLWTSEKIVDDLIAQIRSQVKNDKVILGISGGVDSFVTAILLHKAIGKNLICIFIDNGLLRLNERFQVMKMFSDYFGINISQVEAEQRFFSALAGEKDPEKKRKIIGRVFIEVFDEEALKLNGVKWLAQGTIYPDVIESSLSSTGKAHVIKSHHNVGGLPKVMKMKLVEPLRELFKDEVRKIGIELGLPHNILYRHPFPGPGLGIRVLGEVKKEYCDILRRADEIFIEELRKNNLYEKVSQAFTVFLPIRSVGVMGDSRRYEWVVSLRAIETIDFMTASWAHLPYTFLNRVSSRIINEVRGISRVVYDISSKPPSTIEWE